MGTRAGKEEVQLTALSDPGSVASGTEKGHKGGRKWELGVRVSRLSMVTVVTCEGGCRHRGKCREAMDKLTMQLLQLLSGPTIISKRKVKFGSGTPQIKSGLEG